MTPWLKPSLNLDDELVHDDTHELGMDVADLMAAGLALSAGELQDILAALHRGHRVPGIAAIRAFDAHYSLGTQVPAEAEA